MSLIRGKSHTCSSSIHLLRLIVSTERAPGLLYQKSPRRFGEAFRQDWKTLYAVVTLEAGEGLKGEGCRAEIGFNIRIREKGHVPVVVTNKQQQIRRFIPYRR